MSDTQNGKTLDDKSVLLVVEFHKLGNTRKVNMNRVEVNADKSMLHMNKNLLASPEYDAIKTHDGKTRQWLYSRALPSLFKEGVFRVPNTMVVDVDEYLTKRATERTELVDFFKRSYRLRVTEALERLNGLANPSEYYSADEAASRFGLEWRYVTFDTPNALKNLKDGLFEREREKIVKMVAEAQEEIRSVLRLQLSELVKRMITQLTPKSDGKRKKIYDSLTGNVDDFLSTFDARNIADDVQLQALVAKARNVLKGVDADMLRGEDFARITVKDGFEKINKQLDLMIVDKPARRFDFAE
jgi:hypothetical protein